MMLDAVVWQNHLCLMSDLEDWWYTSVTIRSVRVYNKLNCKVCAGAPIYYEAILKKVDAALITE